MSKRRARQRAASILLKVSSTRLLRLLTLPSLSREAMLISVDRYLGQRVGESREGRKGRYTLRAERGQECE